MGSGEAEHTGIFGGGHRDAHAPEPRRLIRAPLAVALAAMAVAFVALRRLGLAAASCLEAEAQSPGSGGSEAVDDSWGSGLGLPRFYREVASAPSSGSQLA